MYVTQGEQDVLFSKGLKSGVINWIPKRPEQKELDLYAKFRYRQPEQKVHVTINDDGSTIVKFYEPQRAITPGQFVVFYDDEYCLGGGIIEEVIKEFN